MSKPIPIDVMHAANWVANMEGHMPEAIREVLRLAIHAYVRELDAWESIRKDEKAEEER